MRSDFMARKKLFVDGDIANTIHQVWDLYTTSQAAKGVSDITLRNYKQHLHSISKYLDIERSISPSSFYTKRKGQGHSLALGLITQ